MILKKCEFTELMLPITYSWLKNNELKKLTNTPDFTKEEQNNWYSKIIKDKTYMIWTICVDNKPVGVFGIKNIDSKKGEYWGYIGDKSYWGKGIGKWMLDESINFCNKNNINRLYLRVLKNNARAIKLYIKKGFKIISSNNEILKMEIITK